VQPVTDPPPGPAPDAAADRPVDRIIHTLGRAHGSSLADLSLVVERVVGDVDGRTGLCIG